MHVCNTVYKDACTVCTVYSKVSDMPKQAYKNMDSAYVMVRVCMCRYQHSTRRPHGLTANWQALGMSTARYAHTADKINNFVFSL